jgi:hypothetical protein
MLKAEVAVSGVRSSRDEKSSWSSTDAGKMKIGRAPLAREVGRLISAQSHFFPRASVISSQ